MDSDARATELAEDILRIYRSAPSEAEAKIEVYLEEKMGTLPPNGRMRQQEALLQCFDSPRETTVAKALPDRMILSKVYRLLMGREMPKASLSSEELLGRLGDSLNTVFDVLNDLVRAIELTLMGAEKPEQTLRRVIGSQLTGDGDSESLEVYLSRIKMAFLVAHQAFTKAAHAKVEEILNELDPQIISKARGTGMKFGPLRKAVLFDDYQERFQSCTTWFESGRFMEAFLREFEKKAQRLLSQR